MSNSVNVFEFTRDRIRLDELVMRFTDLKPSAGKLIGSCPLPNHRDSALSFYVYDDGYVHCVGCGFHGDAIDIWAGVKGLQSALQAAFDLALEYDIKLPIRDAELDRKAEKCREKEASYLQLAQQCHLALFNQPPVADWWAQRGFNEELQSKFLLGTTLDGTAAVIPFWHRRRIVGLIQRNLQGEPKSLIPEDEDFAGGYKPLFMPISIHGEVHQVGDYIDALALAALGLSAVAVGGTGISDRQKAQLEQLIGPIFIFPDERGANTPRGWVKDQYPHARLCPAEYGNSGSNMLCKDVADLFEAVGEDAKQTIEQLKARATDALGLVLAESPDGTLERYRYAREHALPLLLRLKDQGERYAALDDVTKKLGLKGDSKRSLKSDLKTLCESDSDSEAEAAEANDDASVPDPGSDRYKRAMCLLTSPKLLLLAARAMRRLGHVGELKLKLLAFICAISARMGRPIQPSTHAKTSAGKNALWDIVLALFPSEMVIRRSGLSAKALFRTKANLKGAILYIQEMAGSEAAEYSIRVMQSNGRLEYEATEKAKDGSLRNVVYSTEGPTVIVQTTTKNHLHSENETRVFSLYIDESEKQTKRIVQSTLREAAGGEIEKEKRQEILEAWRDAIKLLEPGDVIIPYAERIVMPSMLVRIRRDARRLLDVVRVIAWLYQYQRERDSANRIIATEGDFNTALMLVSDSLARAWQTLTPAKERVIEVIQKLPKVKQTGGFSAAI